MTEKNGVDSEGGGSVVQKQAKVDPRCADDAAVLAALQSLDRAVERIVRETQPVLA